VETSKSRLCVALDVPTSEEALSLASVLQGHVGVAKIGLELFTAEGPSVVKAVRELGLDIFLDLKFNDIPNTVRGAVAQVAELGCRMMTVHALGGRKMMAAASQAVASAGTHPMILAVTLLTSLDEMAASEELCLKLPVREMVVHLAREARDAGLDGVVCSPQEISVVRQACGPEFKIVTPGIRPRCGEQNDQARTMTPRDAILAGADYLVVGRPITSSSNPAAAADQIAAEMR